MKFLYASLPAVLLLALLPGALTLWAEPEEVWDSPLMLAFDEEVPADQVVALTRALSEKAPWQMRVEATFLRIEAAAADALLGEHRPERAGSARVIPDALAHKLLALAAGQDGVLREPLPPLALYDGQRGRLMAHGRHRYLQDYEVEVPTRAAGPLPIVGTIRDGTVVDVRVQREGEHLLLDVSPCWAEVIRPIPRFETTLASAPQSKKHAVTIELPEMRVFQVREQVTLPAAGGVVLAGGGLAWDGASLRVVVLELRTSR